MKSNVNMGRRHDWILFMKSSRQGRPPRRRRGPLPRLQGLRASLSISTSCRGSGRRKENPPRSGGHWTTDGKSTIIDANNSFQILRPQDKIINELSWGTKLKIFKDLPGKPQRRVGLSFLRMPDDTTIDTKSTKSLSTTVKSEDSSMKMKLFRLMYETVRDSDLKVKRAELIKTHYSNYSSFEVGFILGDITDKFNIMTDIGLTLKRLYVEWKPMEHINAYEQIANKGIEISHLIDIIRIINKRAPPSTIASSPPPPPPGYL